MKGRVLWMVLIMSFIAINGAFAGGHYVNGVEGLKAATLPPPGFYWRMYNTYYTADQMKDSYGKKISPDFKLNVYALTNRFVWVTDFELLGANLFMDGLIPLVYTDISMQNAGKSSFSDNSWGFGDPAFEPFALSWHGERFDAAVGAAVFIPVGSYDYKRQANAGKGYWTFMFTGGGTVYFDQEKTWHASALARYQVNTKQIGTDLTPGNNFSFEWGAGKEVIKGVDVGAAGYCSWQVSDDAGPGATKDRSVAYAIGPEISFPIPGIDILASARFLWEFENKTNPQGNVLNLTLTKRF